MRDLYPVCYKVDIFPVEIFRLYQILTILRFVLVVILRFKSCLKILIASFLIFSLTSSKQAKSWSLYKRALSFPYFSSNKLRI